MASDASLLICRIEFGTPEYDEAVRLRYIVLREPLGLDFTAEQLAAEYTDYHLGIYLPNGRLGGYLCFTPLSDTELKMRQVAIMPNMQKSGLGTALVNASEAFARAQGATLISMHARDTAIPFYERLGYSKVGAEFEEVGIPHYKLVKSV